VLWRLAGKNSWRWAALAVGVAYPLATAWVVMATANHYLMDVLAGAAATALSVVVVELLCPPALKALRGLYQRSST
jgi:membrane-associated phospholipid phosphatase